MGIIKKIDRELFRAAREIGRGVVRPCNPSRHATCRRSCCYMRPSDGGVKCYLTANEKAQRNNYPRRKLNRVKPKISRPCAHLMYNVYAHAITQGKK